MSGTVIKLKYSDVTAQPAPNALAHAEPAYSFQSGRLFIGRNNNLTVDPIIVGGTYYTDMMNHTKGILTANSALLVDQNKHLDEIIVGGLTLTSSGGAGQKITSIEVSMPSSPGNNQLLTAQAIKTYVDTSDESVITYVDAQDQALRLYIDDLAQGLAVKPAVRAATTGNLSSLYDNGPTNNGIGATLNLGPAANLNIDGITVWEQFDGILVKNQNSALENGRYFVSQVGNASTDWILTRCSLCDEANEIPSMYVFVQEGIQNHSTGWVAFVADHANFDVGVDAINFTQFSGSGTYTAGLGIELNGTVFSAKVGAALTLTANGIEVSSTIAGSGLSFSNGVISVGGTTNRITVNPTSIDIASNYAGQVSINTVGTITTGTWNAGTIQPTYGGTGITSYELGDILYATGSGTLSKLAIGTPGMVLSVNDSGVPVWGDIDGGTF